MRKIDFICSKAITPFVLKLDTGLCEVSVCDTSIYTEKYMPRCIRKVSRYECECDGHCVRDEKTSDDNFGVRAFSRVSCFKLMCFFVFILSLFLASTISRVCNDFIYSGSNDDATYRQNSSAQFNE